MNGMKRMTFLIGLFLVLASLAGSAAVLARSALQEITASEDSVMVEPGQPDSSLFIGDDPDEDGYMGLVPAQDNAIVAPSEVDADDSEPVDWTLYMQGPQPDEEEAAMMSESISGISDWSTFRYINIAGATLVPRSSATDWTYPGGGCISASGANDIFNIHLPIPNGSRIDYLRIYFYDTSANNSQAWVTTYNGAGAFADLTSVSSSGTAGYGTLLSPFVGHVVDSASDSYVLNWRSNQTGSTMRLCGLRIAYRDPS
jgi:hypothetical protein